MGCELPSGAVHCRLHTAKTTLKLPSPQPPTGWVFRPTPEEIQQEFPRASGCRGPINQKFRRGVGGQRGLARGNPSKARASGLFFVHFCLCSPRRRGTNFWRTFWTLFGGLFVANPLPPTPFRNLRIKQAKMGKIGKKKKKNSPPRAEPRECDNCPPKLPSKAGKISEILVYVTLRLSQEWPRQTKPKKGQFMNFSQGHAGTKVQCESCLFSQGKTPETKMGEIHELFVLALSLVWFAGATPDYLPPKFRGRTGRCNFVIFAQFSGISAPEASQAL